MHCRFAIVVCLLSFATSVSATEYLNGVKWEKPAIVDPGKSAASAPADAVVLFNGKDLSHWKNGERWSVEGDAMIAGKGVVTSKEEFGDCQIHIEWSAPTPPK